MRNIASVLVAVLALIGSSAWAEDGCGVSVVKPVVSGLDLSRGSRIRGGEEAIPHSWPWQVRVGARLILGLATVMCGGSILDDRHVLTAAHCFTPNFGPNPKFFVLVGDHNVQVNEPSQRTVDVERVFSHPDFFMDEGVGNDIAILRLKTPLTFNDQVKPICMPEQGHDVGTDGRCVVTGWGSTVNQTSGVKKFTPAMQLFKGEKAQPIVRPSNILKQAKMDILDRDQCRLIWGPIILDQMICTFDVNFEDEPCQGDSGGPLNCQNDDGSWTVAGVVSFGGGCGVRAPAVFTRVGEFIPWINNIISS